ncbi:phage protein [Streptococcus gallolyticus]|uniref:Phage protein n=1 Tax=Streptococcus gallolyticus TaxID=315405 RepID=A0AA94M1X0_9STRE|nr:hypothetical protein [Streptococcus gallolyticus]AQP41488.1 hypothetical protein BTR42_02455 [Streptococcus gallolyticus subsp. gallolyticus DSM 16831]SQG78774.1 phage protein [Streptococcus gallolyticus]
MTQFNNNFDHELAWDDEITTDAKGFVQITPGDYQFTVTNLERGRHTPNPQKPGKLPACNKATITIVIETAEGEAQLTHNLFLHTSTEGMLSAFFGAIGQKKHGEPLRMNWNSVIGAKGVCRVNKRKGTGQYADREYDNVKAMIYADDVDWTKVLNANVQSQQPTYQQPAQNYQAPAQLTAQPQQYPQQPQAPQQAAGFQAGQF